MESFTKIKRVLSKHWLIDSTQDVVVMDQLSIVVPYIVGGNVF